MCSLERLRYGLQISERHEYNGDSSGNMSWRGKYCGGDDRGFSTVISYRVLTQIPPMCDDRVRVRVMYGIHTHIIRSTTSEYKKMDVFFLKKT